MNAIKLQHTTGNSQVDRILQGIVGLYELSFPGYIRAYYVTGSFADDSAVPISDIDFMIIFGKPLTRQQLDQALALIDHCGLISPIRLDIGMELEQRLAGMACTSLKLGSRLVYGDDLRDQLQLPPIALYQRDVTWSPYRFLGQMLRQQQTLAYPLTYPDAHDPFYGYTQKRIDHWYPAEVRHGTKELVTGIARTATALVALRAQRYVGTKQASIRLYREAIGDEWSDYLEELYHYGKRVWHYQIPADQADQQRLRELCQQTLAFENHYFAHYRTYLLELLHGSDDDRRFAGKRLARVVYGDAEMLKALQQNTQAANPEVRSAAEQALTEIAQIDMEISTSQSPVGVV